MHLQAVSQKLVREKKSKEEINYDGSDYLTATTNTTVQQISSDDGTSFFVVSTFWNIYKSLYRDLTKNCIHRWTISIWKDTLHIMSSGKCRLKQQWDTAAHLLEIVKISNTDNIKCWQACGATGSLIHYWWECKNNNLVVSYKIKQTLTL